MPDPRLIWLYTFTGVENENEKIRVSNIVYWLIWSYTFTGVKKECLTKNSGEVDWLIWSYTFAGFVSEHPAAEIAAAT